MKNLRLFARSLRDHPAKWIALFYMALPAFYEAVHYSGAINWRRLILASTCFAMVTLIPVMIAAWRLRHFYDDKPTASN